MNKKMTGVCYLTLEKLGRRRDKHDVKVVGVTKAQPSLHPGQVAIKINLSVPAELFDAATKVSIQIEEKHIIKPKIDATLGAR